MLVVGIWAGTAGAEEPDDTPASTSAIHAQDVEVPISPTTPPFLRPTRAWQETGVASWYGPRFHGKKTASGERFDQWALTAAHRTLPLGALIEVFNVANGRRVVVKINDRGPHTRGVMLDLSKGAAQVLGLIRAGRGKVRISRAAHALS